MLLKKGLVPIVSLECVSCKAQSVYEVSQSSYVYLEGTCLNCQNNSKLGVRRLQGVSGAMGGGGGGGAPACLPACDSCVLPWECASERPMVPKCKEQLQQ